MKLPPYPKYKPGGVEWLGEVPAHWEVKTLTSIANEIRTGPFGSQLHASEYVEDGIPVVNPAHITSRSIRPDILSGVDDATALRLERHRLKQHDIIVGRRGEIGRCAVVGQQEDGWLCGTGALVVRLHNSDPRYIFAVFSGPGFRGVLSLNAVGTTMLNLNPMIVGRMLSPVPPVPEQRAIADFLDRETAKIDTLVTKKRTLIERLKEKRTALISGTVTRGLPPDAARAAGLEPYPKLKPTGIDWLGDVPEHWEVAKLSRVTVSKCDGPFGSGLKSEHYTEGKGIRVIRLQNIRFAEFDDRDIAFIEPEHYKELGDHDVFAGDVLIAGLGDENNPVGRACVAPSALGPTMVKADCFRFRLDRRKVEAAYVALQLSAVAYTLAGALATGTTRGRMNLSTTATRAVAIPPLGEQISIVSFLSHETAEIDTLVAKIETAIERLQEYHAALVTAAVTGKIDVRGTVAAEERAA